MGFPISVTFCWTMDSKTTFLLPRNRGDESLPQPFATESPFPRLPDHLPTLTPTDEPAFPRTLHRPSEITSEHTHTSDWIRDLTDRSCTVNGSSQHPGLRSKCCFYVRC